jgi:hypothetical protein
MSKSPKWQSYVFLITFIVILASQISRLAWPSAQETLTRAFFVSIYFALCLLVGLAADRTFHRSFAGWTVLALFFTPFTAVIFLVVAGSPLTAYDQVCKDRDVETKAAIADEEYQGEYVCPLCGNSFNLVTHRGLHSPDDEPWRLICEQCDREIDVDALDE